MPPTRPVRNDAVVTGRIYSIGYEGMTVESLVDRLAGAKVTTLVDVRLNPISRKPGFSRKRLTTALDDAGIEYVHEKDLGNPADNRDSFRDGDGQAGRQRVRHCDRLARGRWAEVGHREGVRHLLADDVLTAAGLVDG